MLNIIGTFLGSSGYDIHCRELANALNKITKVRLDAIIPSNLASQLNDQEVEMLKRDPDEEINLIITNPMHWRLNTNAKRNWAYLIWEGDRIPKCYVNECSNDNIEYIFVPSTHTKQAIIKTFNEIYGEPSPEWIHNKIKLIPHGVDLKKFYPSPQDGKDVAYSENSETRSSAGTFVFFANKGFRNLEDRGGIQYLIKAYMEEFTTKDNVELFLKLNPAYGIPDVNRLIEQLKPDKLDLPKIRVDISNYEYEKLVDLYHKADVFVSPTRAESFNLPCLEACACALPVITTNFGGQTDFITTSNGWLIGGDLSEVQHEIQYEGVKWLTPDIDQLKKAMREAHAKTSRKEKGEKALETAKKFTWDLTAHKIVDLI